MTPEYLKDFIQITNGVDKYFVTSEQWLNILRRQDYYLSEGDTTENGIYESNGLYKSYNFTVYNAGTLAKQPFYRRWSEVVDEGEVLGDGCPKCGCRGEFVRMALCCPTHGVFGGI
jgi:hypothetical protein